MDRGCFTTAQLAAKWQVTPRTIRNMVARGELPCLRIGRAVRIPIEEVEQWEMR